MKLRFETEVFERASHAFHHRAEISRCSGELDRTGRDTHDRVEACEVAGREDHATPGERPLIETVRGL